MVEDMLYGMGPSRGMTVEDEGLAGHLIRQAVGGKKAPG